MMQFQILSFFLLPYCQLCPLVLPYLGKISSAFSLSNFKPFLIKKVRTVTVQKQNISQDTCHCLHSWQPLLTTVLSFLDVHIRFRTFRIVVRPNWNNYYNITNVSTKLWQNQMKTISGSHCFLHLFTNLTFPNNFTISMWMDVSFLLGASARICQNNFLIDPTKFEIWLFSICHMKM